jgi:hypothetical protein
MSEPKLMLDRVGPCVSSEGADDHLTMGSCFRGPMGGNLGALDGEVMAVRILNISHTGSFQPGLWREEATKYDKRNPSPSSAVFGTTLKLSIRGVGQSEVRGIGGSGSGLWKL